MKNTFTKLFAALALLVFMTPSLAGWGQEPIMLFHETFGNNTGSARAWDDSYSVKTGVSSVYEDITSYEVSNLKQGKNTTGYVQSGLNQSTQGTDAYVVIGPLHVANYTDLSLSYYWKAASIKQTYSTSIYYKTSADGSYSQITHSTQGATGFVEVNVSLPEAAQTNTLYLKIVWNTSNTQAIIDEVDLQGVSSGGVTTTDPTITFNDGSVNVGKTLDLSTLFESNSSGAVTYSITSGGSYATLSGTGNSILTGVAVGDVTVEASQAAAGSYNAGSAEATITVNAAPTLSSIAITTPPTKITYTEGETFDATGMVVTATYSDDTTDDVTASCTFTPSGALTTSDTEIIVSYTEGGVTKTATQEITVNAYVQPTNFDINLNNSLFGTSYNGSASGITDEQPVSGTSNGVIVTYAGSGNHYINNSQIRFYPSNKLTFEAPSGYVIKNIVFTADGQWNATITANVGSYNDTNKTWTGSAASVIFTGSGSGVHCRMSKATITLEVPAPEYDITYAAVTNGVFDSSNPNSASAGSTVTVATTPNVGYRLATMTYNDGTNTESATISGNSGSFTMPEQAVTVSATFTENEAEFTDGVYSEPMTTQASFDNMTVVSVTGDDWVWHYESGTNAGAYINGYSNNTNHENVDWLITPKMSVTNGKLDISFDYWHYYQDNQLAVKWSTSNDLAGAWNTLSFTEGDRNTWHNNTFTIETSAANVYVAFVYTGTDLASGAYRVRNFTAKQYYTITNGNPSNGSIEIEPSDKQVVGGTVLVEATPNANYHFVSWNITPAVTVENDAFTMPAANVTVSAVFEANVSYTITFSENGSVITDNVFSGPIGTKLLDSPINPDPANLTFVGWSTSQISKYATAQPELVDATYNVTGDVTFYAVYKYDYSYNEGGGTATWTKVTDASTLAEGDLLVIASDAQNVVATEAITTSSNANYMSETGEDDLFESGVMNSLPTGAAVLTLGGEENAWTLTNSSNQLLGATAAKKLAWGSGTTTWSISISSGDATIQNGTSSYGKFLHNVSSTRFTTYTSDPSSSMLLPQLYRLEGSSTTVSGTYYLTSVTEIATETTIAANSTTTLTNNVTVNSTTGSYVVNGILDGAGYIIINKQTGRLVVNNGGQLICDNAVTATVNKDVAAAGNWLTESSGWNFIASPLTSAYTLSGSSMVSGTYDLYRLNNTNWENYKNSAHSDFTTLNNETGYLYANNTAVTLSFEGTVKPYDADLNIAVTEGWNLIGNPYPFNAYANVAYYAMNESGTGITATTVATSTAVKPCTGIIIKAAGDGNVKFLDEAPVGSANNSNLQITLAHNVTSRDGASVNSTLDNAIVSFNEGTKLQKFYFGEPAANIFIPQNGEDYAIAFSNRQGDMPLNFKTTEAGMYTISFEGDNMDLKGVSLIDMLAEEEIDLSVDPSYTFIGSPADKAERFKIVFRGFFDGASDEIFAFQSGSDIIVSGEGELQIFDVMGRRVKTQYVSGVQTVNVNAQGVYIMKLNEKTQKIIVR